MITADGNQKAERPQQQSAVDVVYNHLRSKDDNPCIVLPTGYHAKDHPILRRAFCRKHKSHEIIHAIIAGTLEKDIGIEQLKQAMPLMWDDQKKMFGME